jgi:hypothetical protein
MLQRDAVRKLNSMLRAGNSGNQMIPFYIGSPLF